MSSRNKASRHQNNHRNAAKAPSWRRPSEAARQNRDSRNAPAPKSALPEREAAAAAVYAEAVDSFRALSQAVFARTEFGSQIYREAALDPLTRTFDEDARRAIVATKDSDLSLILAAGGVARHVALGIIAERARLGGQTLGADPDDGTAVGFLFAEESDDISWSIDDNEREDLEMRLMMLSGDGRDAALAVGTWIARDGAWDPFCYAPWLAGGLHSSLFGAALAAAAVARFKYDTGAGGDTAEQYSRDPGVYDQAKTLARAANSAFVALTAGERASLRDFGTASLVIEGFLSEAIRGGYTTIFGEPDAHRVGRLLSQAFAAGREGKAHGIEESNPVGRLLLDAAEAVGRSASEDIVATIEGFTGTRARGARPN
jgi:hypothetical protein